MLCFSDWMEYPLVPHIPYNEAFLFQILMSSLSDQFLCSQHESLFHNVEILFLWYFFLLIGMLYIKISKNRKMSLWYIFLNFYNNEFMIHHCCRWENDIVDMIEQKHGKQKISVSFECETLKADNAAEEHLKSYMPNLVGLCAVGR